MESREDLPYRKNCEGYFICDDGAIIARDTGKGFLEIPGGGVDEGEDPVKAVVREAYEEAGVILDGEIEELDKLYFIWGETWAKTDKQRKRYNEFKGEEMTFFFGKVKELVDPPGDSKEQGWSGDRKMSIDAAIGIIKKEEPFSEDIKEYREMQLKFLEEVKKR